MALSIKKIEPNPLVSSAIEIRFESTLGDDEVLSKFFPLFSSRFPKFVNKLPIPSNIKDKREETKYLVDYSFMNDNYSVSVSKNSILFEHLNNYNGWDDFFSVIKENLTLIASVQEIKKVLRIGVRYASIFEFNESIEKILNISVASVDGYLQDNITIKSGFKKGDILFLVQLLNRVQLDRNDNNGERRTITGFFADIDTSITENIPAEINDNFYSLIDTLHTELKTLLFDKLLKEEFIKTLNVTH